MVLRVHPLVPTVLHRTPPPREVEPWVGPWGDGGSDEELVLKGNGTRNDGRPSVSVT